MHINIVKKIFKCLVIAVLLFSIYNIFILINEYSNSKEVYKEIRGKKEDINLSNINSDYIGWISIENTPVDYPVVKGSDNEFYLENGFNKEYLISGSIFMDYRNSGFQDKNVIIYGHNMKNNSMFGSLKNFKDIDYLANNKYITITNKNNERRVYEIFALYITGADNTYYTSIEFYTEEEFDLYIESILSQTLYKTDIEIKNTDNILTLSTCSYEFDNARLAIHAKLIN